MPDPALGLLHDIVAAKKSDRKFWNANGDDTVEVLKKMITEKGAQLTSNHRRVIALIADILVDNGVRGAGFLQQELLRAS